jgi:hypothetical protein
LFRFQGFLGLLQKIFFALSCFDESIGRTFLLFKTVFLNLFWFSLPYLDYKTIWRHPCHNLLVNWCQFNKCAAFQELFRALRLRTTVPRKCNMEFLFSHLAPKNAKTCSKSISHFLFNKVQLSLLLLLSLFLIRLLSIITSNYEFFVD